MGSGFDATRITIVHFNDVYNIEEQAAEPVGGAARFKTAVKQLADLDPLILFSGDAFNPSLMSTVNKGRQMVPVLNSIGVNCAVYGNHDFDHGIDALVQLAKDSTFPWLLSNVFDVLTNLPLADGKCTHTIDWKGKKLGFLGLVEEEWIATLATIDPEEIIFVDYVEEGRRLAKELRSQGCEYIIALTHMRWPNDTRLAEQVEEIDLILGGHDHDFVIKQVNGKYIIKSGTDFRQMCQVTLDFSADGHVAIATKEIKVDSSFPPDPEVQDIVKTFTEIMSEKMDQVLAHFDVDLDGRFSSLRTQETNLGNFITDIMLEVTESDFALLNSGTLRSDRIHPKGEFKIKDLFSILPLIDPVVVIKVTGAQVLQLLENGVSQYPKLEGRFPQVSGITFGFDPEAPPGQRVDGRFVMVQGEYLDPLKEYRVATKHYLAEGKDGYTVFKQGVVMLNEEEGPRLSTSVQNHFKSVEIIQGKKQILQSQHRQSLIPVAKRKRLVKQLSLEEEDFKILLTPSLSKRHSLSSPTGKRLLLRRRSSIQTLEQRQVAQMLAPQVEGRIFHLNKMKVRELEETRLAHDIQNTVIDEGDELNVPDSPLPADNNHFQ